MSSKNLQSPTIHAPSPSSLEKALPLLLVLLVPLLVLVGDRSLIFNHAGYLDPWIYYGLYRNLAAIKLLFPLTYYPSRLSLILPGYLVNQLFAPLTANYVLHLLIWFAAVAGLYTVVKHVAGRRSALLAATVFGFCPYLWRAVGWDYPDGIGNAYYLLTMAFLTLAARNQTASRRYLFLAGITCAGAVYCNLTWAFLIPSFGPYWLFVRRARDYSFALGRTLVWSAAGFLFLSLIFAVVNHRLSGFYLFYMPSINYAIGGIKGPSPYGAKGARWLLTSPSLYLPMAALLAGPAGLIRFRWRQGDFHARMVVALYVNLLLCVGALAAWELAGQPLLQIPYYASYLLASTFLFLGVTVLPVSETLSSRTFCLLLAGVVVMFSWVWWDTTGTTWMWMVRRSWAPVVVVAIAAIVIGGAFIGRTWAVTLGAVGVCLLSLNARTPDSGLLMGTAHASEATFRRIVESIEIGVDAARPAEMLHFWYDNDDKNGQEFSSINSSYLYAYTKVPSNYPNLPVSPPEGLTAILSSLPDTERKTTLTRVRDTLKRGGFEMRVVADRVVDREGVRYGVTIIKQTRVVEPKPVVTQTPVVEPTRVVTPAQADAHLRYGDFESGAAMWAGGSARPRVVNGGQSGKALELVPEKGRSQSAVQWNCVRLARGKTYKLVAWTKSGSAGDQPFVVGVWDDTTSSFVAAKYGRTSTEWRRYEVPFTNDSDNLLSIELMKHSPSMGTILFDSITLTETN